MKKDACQEDLAPTDNPQELDIRQITFTLNKIYNENNKPSHNQNLKVIQVL